MIKINLLGDEVKRDSSAILWVAGMVVSFIGFGIIATFLYFDISSQLVIKEREVKDLDRQLAQLKEKTKEVSGLEQKKNELKTKLSIIAELKLSKYGPVRVLDDLNLGVPERAWLTGVQERGTSLSITGYALDGQTVATFMNTLEKSDYFADIKVETKQASYDGVKLQTFALQSKLSYAGMLKSKQAMEEGKEGEEAKEGKEGEEATS